MSDARSSPLQRLIASAVVLPLGLGAKFVDELPTAVAAANSRADAIRAAGSAAIARAIAELQRLGGPAAPAPPPSGAAGLAPTTEIEVEPVAHPPADALALPDYDQLPAAHIVGKLADLTAGERDDIEAYESAHRNRRTVLGRLDQLRVAGPG
ncbi:MAG: hypothetical protein HKN44_12735 [Ilumatobacter sp.]|nr:hypothetical protein [Ilumatobacter sp.]